MERFKRSGNFSRVANSWLARMSVASPSQIGRKSLEDSYDTWHGRKSVASHSWNFSRMAIFAESHRRDIRGSRVTRVIDIGSQVPGRLQIDDSALPTPIFIRSGPNSVANSWTLWIQSQVGLILLAKSQVGCQSSQLGRGSFTSLWRWSCLCRGCYGSSFMPIDIRLTCEGCHPRMSITSHSHNLANS